MTYIPATYEEYDDNGEILTTKKLRIGIYTGEVPVSIVVNLPENKIERAIGLHKSITITLKDLGYNIEIVPET
jgi:hypothetical protein